MEIEDGIFAVKLCELERQFGRLQSRIQLCRHADREKLNREIEQLQEEYAENALLLQKSIEACRDHPAASLAGAQLSCMQEGDRALRRKSFGVSEDAAETAALYAEYDMDFAVQAMRHALLAALTAMELQLDGEIQEKEMCDNE